MTTKGARRWRILAIVAALALLAFLGFLVWAHRPAIAPITRPSPRQFSTADIVRGAALARIGNCLSCHQAAHGRPYAGGFGVKTPFGTVYASNITPDPDTGIGQWSGAAFVRALREGVGRDGKHLYPALPYDHFTQASDADLHALYAFFITRQPAASTPPANRLIPPLGFRPLLAGWKLLFFRPHRFQPPAGLPPRLERGAYLGEALAHCGACHSPRGPLGNELRDRAYRGGWSDGWYAPPLDRYSPAVRAWTAERLETYLTTGLDVNHAAAAGPMGEVAHSLAGAKPADVRAIAGYYAWLMRDAPAARTEPALADRRKAADRAFPLGAQLFAGACASCHEPGAPMMVAGRPSLALGTPLHEDNPRDLIAIILHGLAPRVSAKGPMMPAFADTLDDHQIAQIGAYLRLRYGSGRPWAALEREVAKARKATAP